MTFQKKNTWVKFAGHARRIKNKEKHHWRCFVDDDPTGILIDGLSLIGIASARNFIPESNSNGGNLIAWIRLYGDLKIDGHRARLRLKEPPRE